MHIHYGLKGNNPVDRLRFYPKTVCVSNQQYQHHDNSSTNNSNNSNTNDNNYPTSYGNDNANSNGYQYITPIIGRQISEDRYTELLPRCFERLALRVFCRSSSYSQTALYIRKGYEMFCKLNSMSIPFPSASQ